MPQSPVSDSHTQQTLKPASRQSIQHKNRNDYVFLTPMPTVLSIDQPNQSIV